MKTVISHIIGYLEGLEKVKMRIKPLATVVGGNSLKAHLRPRVGRLAG